MHRTNIYLDDEQLRALKHLAAEEHASVADLVRKAIDAYLVPRFSSGKDWGRRFDDLVERIQRRMPPDVTPEEIEADITAARAEVRQAHQARTAASGHAPALTPISGCPARSSRAAVRLRSGKR